MVDYLQGIILPEDPCNSEVQKLVENYLCVNGTLLTFVDRDLIKSRVLVQPELTKDLLWHVHHVTGHGAIDKCVPNIQKTFTCGPYNIKLLSVHYCDDGEPDTFNYTLKLTKKSKSETVWTTPFNLIYDMDGDVWVKYTAAKWGAGGWGENAIVQDFKPFCSKLREIAPRVFKIVADSLGVPDECPLPKGSHTLNELPVNLGRLEKFPAMPYGKYKMKLEYMKREERFACSVTVAEITEEAARK
ncbi:uncharacterized protein [Anabrus simplex]|uniref:uncharacterized protein n=1 Tax=Anabrus simplex TaxID=316456 RepID=UPI0035A2B104